MAQPYIPNFTFQYPVYQPATRVISAITQAINPTVTTSVNHQYIVGTLVRFDIPLNFGMPQINQQVGTILSVPTTTTYTIDINTTNYSPFVIPTFPSNPTIIGYTSAQCVPIGEINDILTAATQNVLPYRGV